MAVKLFPDAEVKKLNENVFVHHYPPGVYRLWFKVNHQYFQIGSSHDDEETVLWHGEMFCKALSNLKNEKS